MKRARAGSKMRHRERGARRSIHMGRTMLVGLCLTAAVVFLVGIPAGRAEERLEGKVIKTHLTACSVVPGKAGTCEGTLVLEPQVGEGATPVTVRITRDTVLKKGQEKAFLFQLVGSTVVVTYVTEGDQKRATSVVTRSSGR
jgi:hypothetical protein